MKFYGNPITQMPTCSSASASVHEEATGPTARFENSQFDKLKLIEHELITTLMELKKLHYLREIRELLELVDERGGRITFSLFWRR